MKSIQQDGILVRITKISENSHRDIKPGWWGEGQMVGTEPEVGKQVTIYPLSRHSSPESFTWMHTSPVKEWAVLPNGWSVKTQNSTYHIERL